MKTVPASAGSILAKLKLSRARGAPLCDQLRDGIRTCIVEGRLQANDALLPVRMLCRRLGINRVTADQAIRDLVNEGLLRSDHGRGVFVNNVSPRSVALVAYIRTGRENQGTGYSAIVRDAQQLLAQAQVRTRLFTRSKTARERKFGPDLAEVLAASADAYLTVGVQDSGYLGALARTGRPLVAVDAAPLATDFDGVVLDSFRTGYLAARHLLELGHRRILHVGYDRGLHSGDPSGRARVPEPDSERQRAGVVFALKEAGVSLDEATLVDFLAADSHDELRRSVRQRGLTAAIMNAAPAKALLQADVLHKKLCVVVTEVTRSAVLSRNWARVCLDESQYSRLGVARLLARLERSRTSVAMPPAVSMIEPFLVPGASSCRVGPSPTLYAYGSRKGENHAIAAVV